jgi:bifunctional non-homologous end joining protein LigD
VINLGCIDLNQWYAKCDDVDRPDYVHFDLDPGEGATWENVLACGRIVHDALDTLEMPSVVKTTGSRGLHVYVPIVRVRSRRTSGRSQRLWRSSLPRGIQS